MCLGARGGPMGGELLVVLRVNRVTVRHPLLLLLLLQVNQSMWITAAGDSRLPPPLHKRDFDMMKECIDVRGGEPSLPLLRPAHPPSPPHRQPVLAEEAAAAKKHEDDYRALVNEYAEQGRVAPEKKPYVKPSTRHCHLIQREQSGGGGGSLHRTSSSGDTKAYAGSVRDCLPSSRPSAALQARSPTTRRTRAGRAST